MKSSFDILKGLYRVLAPALAGEITGKVIQGAEPLTSEKENVLINLLNNSGNYLQEGFLNVNISVMGVDDRTANGVRMDEIVKIILPLLDEQDYYFPEELLTLHLTVDDDKGVFEDKEIEGKFFYNIKVKFLTV